MVSLSNKMDNSEMVAKKDLVVEEIENKGFDLDLYVEFYKFKTGEKKT